MYGNLGFFFLLLFIDFSVKNMGVVLQVESFALLWTVLLLPLLPLTKQEYGGISVNSHWEHRFGGDV